MANNLELKNYAIAELFIDGVHMGEEVAVNLQVSSGIIPTMTVKGFAGATQGTPQAKLSGTCRVPIASLPIDPNALKTMNTSPVRQFDYKLGDFYYTAKGYILDYSISYRAGAEADFTFDCILSYGALE